eukprot:7171069-Lingulodinium_polyedra.AAC.1
MTAPSSLRHLRKIEVLVNSAPAPQRNIRTHHGVVPASLEVRYNRGMGLPKFHNSFFTDGHARAGA